MEKETEDKVKDIAEDVVEEVASATEDGDFATIEFKNRRGQIFSITFDFPEIEARSFQLEVVHSLCKNLPKCGALADRGLVAGFEIRQGNDVLFSTNTWPSEGDVITINRPDNDEKLFVTPIKSAGWLVEDYFFLKLKIS